MGTSFTYQTREATARPLTTLVDMREYSVPASFTIGEHDNVASSVYDHERTDPDYVIVQRLVDGAWTDVTCAEVAAQIRSAALGLIAEGVQPGDRVAILSATRYEWALLDYAILSVGGVTVPIYETSSAEQVRWVLEDSGAVLVFTETDAHAQMVSELHDELPALRTALRIESVGPTALDELAERAASADPAELNRRLAELRSADPATLIYTSGTTGRPKGVALTHANLISEIRGATTCFPTLLRQNERLLVFLPMAHVLSRALSMTAFANKVTLGYTSDIKNLVPMLQLFRPTIVVSVPRVFEKVYNTAELNARDSGKGRIFELAAKTAIAYSEAQASGEPNLLLKAAHAVFDRLVYGKLRAALGGDCHAAISGGAPLGKRLGHFYRGVGLSIYEGYGLTETSAAITANRIGELKVGTVGKLIPGNAMKVAGDGELLVKGGVVFTGYWHNEKATAESIVDGWFHTGDLASVDADGFLSITGRKKEIIVTAGGKNVAPAVLEDALRAHPLISQAMAVGDKQPFIGALIAIDPEAFDVWKSHHGKPAGASVGDLRDDPDLIAEVEMAVKDANQHVSHAESIRKFRILPCDFTVLTGELTPTLKVKRNVVAEKFADEIEAIYTK
ncbi:long-chain-fatty-acid--CoA ligase [Mycolicibacterium helvum]|uniref:Acyl-CoA synthetase n=2 Tax=Mycolicibacterium helvum TaxID=1534349 RepID=A0A7I7TEH5_9MYCO|nr:long-chain-fatty-acid--CoA ligase [Mycolicibacterium helvum]